MTVLGLLWLPVVPRLSSQLYIYLQSVQGYIAAPITCVFLVGVLWRGANGTGAMTCLVAGSAIGLLRLIAEITLGRHYAVDTPVLRLVYRLFVGSNFLHFTCGLFITCVGIIVAASLAAPLPAHHPLSNAHAPSLPPLHSLLVGADPAAVCSLGDEVPTTEPGVKRHLVAYALSSAFVVCTIATILFIFH